VAVRRREDWGSRAPVPDEAVEVATDAAARAVVETARRAGHAPPPLVLTGGDLYRTLGGSRDRVPSAEATQVTVDLGAVLADGRLHWFVAHLVARRSWWRGRIWAAMNAEYLGEWDVAPRSHPGDGKLDTFDVSLSAGDRLKARRRLPSGTHVPHPDITERRVAAVQLEFAAPLDLRLDGERLGRVRDLSVRVEPDALVCYVR
jgi:hypothetical protein